MLPQVDRVPPLRQRAQDLARFRFHALPLRVDALSLCVVRVPGRFGHVQRLHHDCGFRGKQSRLGIVQPFGDCVYDGVLRLDDREHHIAEDRVHDGARPLVAVPPVVALDHEVAPPLQAL